jgi:hypothetical protein
MTKWFVRALAVAMLAAIGIAAPAVARSSAAQGGGCSQLPANAFVIGDVSAVPGAAVEFWGAQWVQTNGTSGGSAPHAFKGYADTVTAVGSAGFWSANPGNSSVPPASVPSQIEVIVTSTVAKSGPVISGDVVGVAIVNTDPGYAGDPGHAGTGTVASVTFC